MLNYEFNNLHYFSFIFSKYNLLVILIITFRTYSTTLLIASGGSKNFVGMRSLAINYMIGLDQNCIYSQRRSRICVGRAIKQGLCRLRGLNFFYIH